MSRKPVPQMHLLHQLGIFCLIRRLGPCFLPCSQSLFPPASIAVANIAGSQESPPSSDQAPNLYVPPAATHTETQPLLSGFPHRSWVSVLQTPNLGLPLHFTVFINHFDPGILKVSLNTLLWLSSNPNTF